MLGVVYLLMGVTRRIRTNRTGSINSGVPIMRGWSRLSALLTQMMYSGAILVLEMSAGRRLGMNSAECDILVISPALTGTIVYSLEVVMMR